MRKEEVRTNCVYSVKVSGRIRPVLVTHAHHSKGWHGVNLLSGRTIRILTAAKLRKCLGTKEEVLERAKERGITLKGIY